MNVNIDFGKGKMVEVMDNKIVVAVGLEYCELQLEELFGLVETHEKGYVLVEPVKTKLV